MDLAILFLALFNKALDAVEAVLESDAVPTDLKICLHLLDREMIRRLLQSAEPKMTSVRNVFGVHTTKRIVFEIPVDKEILALVKSSEVRIGNGAVEIALDLEEIEMRPESSLNIWKTQFNSEKEME